MQIRSTATKAPAAPPATDATLLPEEPELWLAAPEAGAGVVAGTAEGAAEGAADGAAEGLTVFRLCLLRFIG